VNLREYCDMLRDSVKDEFDASTRIYPALSDAARDLGFEEDANVFADINVQESQHHVLVSEIMYKRCR